MRNRIFTLMLCLSLLPVFSPGVYAGPIRTIVIDPGHGGNDPGAIGATGSHESEVVLDVALRLGALIRNNHPDVKVIYTRSTDVFIELYRRAEIANKNKADLFISIHCNSAPNATAYGAETFVMGVDKTNANMAVVQKENAAILKETDYQNNYEGFDPYSPESYIIFSLLQNAHLTKSTHFASSVQKYFVNDLHRLDRGVKQAPFLVLWRTTMPSVLIELGFLSNREEEAYLKSEKGKNEMSQSIYKAVAQSIRENSGAASETVTTTVTETVAASDGLPARDSVIVGKPHPTHVDAADTAAVQPKTGAANVPELVYKVQFAASSVQKPADDYAFRGLPKVQCRPNGSVFVYTAGEEPTYEAVQAVLELVRAKGYKDAFVIAFYKGERIRLDQAKNLEKSSGILK
ncbi:MAG: N-acetylmuramoyl-L-alanine amidase [Bacteroidales bacterium]|nr:N-acetylmuramoyl-L-alanine amidase [Bacteroidales bacterium]